MVHRYVSSVFLTFVKFSSLLNIILLYFDNTLNSDLNRKGTLKSAFQDISCGGSAGGEHAHLQWLSFSKQALFRVCRGGYCTLRASVPFGPDQSAINTNISVSSLLRLQRAKVNSFFFSF